MAQSFVRMLLRLARPEGERGIRRLGHREYVGGNWDEIGQLQFDFLVSRGLRPEHYLLDIACGSLRLGVKAVPYLQAGHYLGIDKEAALIEAGVTNELGAVLYAEKKPVLIANAAFEFQQFGVAPNFVIAQSLFTHLTPDLIDLCVANLRPLMKPASVFYATFHQGSSDRNPVTSHAHAYFGYRVEEMLSFGERNGFAAAYLGDWGHPRGQVIVEYRPF